MVILAYAKVCYSSELRKWRPRDFRFNCRMPRLVCRVSVLKAPHFNLTEQRERRLLSMRIADDHLKKSLPNGVALKWGKRVSAAGRTVGTALQKRTFHRPHELVRHDRSVISQDTESFYAIIFAGELAEHLC